MSLQSVPILSDQLRYGRRQTIRALSRAIALNRQRRISRKRVAVRDAVREERVTSPDTAIPRHLATRYPAKAPKPIKEIGSAANKWRVVLGNKANGDVKVVDAARTRIRRMQARIRAWRDAMPIVNRRLRRVLRKSKAAPRFVMLTLTYADIDGWQPNHIREYMLALRKELKEKLWAYAWVAEMQARGAVHYHVIVYVAPNTDVPMPDKSGMWKYGVSRRETAKKGPLYIMTYVGKEHQKIDLPHGARMFAVWISKNIATDGELLPFRLSSAPPYIQEALLEQYAAGYIEASVRWRRRPGGGWLVLDTGEIFQSDWWLISCGLITGLEPPPRTRSPDDVPDDVLLASLVARARSQQIEQMMH